MWSLINSFLFTCSSFSSTPSCPPSFSSSVPPYYLPSISDDGQLSYVSSTDSLNGQRTSSDSGKEAEGPGSLNAPSDSSGPKVNLERRSSGPGPIVPRRKSSDTGQTSRVGSWQDRRSCSSLTERESLFNNGCVNRWSSFTLQYYPHCSPWFLDE